MAARIVVGRILLSTDQQLGVEELAVLARPNLVDGRRIQVDEYRPRHVLAAAGLGEKGVVRARILHILGVGVYATVEAEAVLKAIAMRHKKKKRLAIADVLINAQWRGSRTAPKQRCPAAHQPGQYEGARSKKTNKLAMLAASKLKHKKAAGHKSVGKCRQPGVMTHRERIPR